MASFEAKAQSHVHMVSADAGPFSSGGEHLETSAHEAQFMGKLL